MKPILCRPRSFSTSGPTFSDSLGQLTRIPKSAFLQLPFEGLQGRIFGGMMKFYNRRLSALARNRIAHGATGRHNAGWRELYDGFVPDLRLQKLLRKGLFAMVEGGSAQSAFLFHRGRRGRRAHGAAAQDSAACSCRSWTQAEGSRFSMTDSVAGCVALPFAASFGGTIWTSA